jgi:zinc protease
MLALVMGDVPAGRLHRRLTQAQLAANTWAWTPALHDPGLIVFGADLGPGQDSQTAAKALIAALESTREEPITQDELDRARRRWLKGWDQTYNDPEQLGVALSDSVAQGDWRLFFLLRDRVQQLALTDLQRFALERLLHSNRTLGRFVPTDKADRAPAPKTVSVEQQMVEFKPKPAAPPTQAFDPSPSAIESRLLKSQFQGIKLAQLPKSTRGEVVTMTLRLHLGDLATLTGQGEVPTLWAAMLDKGTQSLSRQAVQDRLDQARAELSVAYRLGVLQVVVQARRDSLVAVTELLGDLLRRPRMDAGVLEEVRRQALASLEQARKEPDALAANALERHGNPYPAGDPRHGRTFDQVDKDLRAVTLDQVRGFHEKLVGAAQMEWSVVGDHDAPTWKACVEREFAGWNIPSPVARLPQPLWNGPPARLEFKTPDKQNATMMIRQSIALSEGDGDQAALMLANFVFGQSGSSRLWMRIREKGGLSYDVRSMVQWNPYEKASVWQASAIFAPENLKAVETAFQEEVERAIKSGFTAQEINEGKNGLLNFRRLQRAQDPLLSMGLARQLELGRSMAEESRLEDAIRALTPEQVHAAFKRYIQPELFVKAVAGDFKSP